MKPGTVPIKPVFWIGSSRKELKTFPKAVQSDVGYVLFAAQR
jgi:phage-related protein